MTSTLVTADDLFQRVRHVVPAVEWATMIDDVEAILRLKEERNAVILAHNYMRPEIFHGVSDIVGDSLALAREATKVEADVIEHVVFRNRKQIDTAGNYGLLLLIGGGAVLVTGLAALLLRKKLVRGR